jgi:prepilin-type N-terminal cleavage/methylation domain-containing protein
MVEVHDHRDGVAGSGGFTLAEMLAALTILLLGVTALLGALAQSVGQRRSTDARHELVALCEHAMLRVANEAVRRPDGSESPLDLEFVPLLDQPAPAFPTMTWSATATADPDRPELWLVRLAVRWLEAGEAVEEVFLRVLPRQLPLAARVVAFRGEGAESSTK